MKTRPILFSGEMVQAILAGRKTQTRRIPKQPLPFICQYGDAGDRLWVRETWRPCAVPQHNDPSCCTEYRASDYCQQGHLGTLNRTGWKPSIHMHRWRSRITLAITGVRLERLQAITQKDAIAEGIRAIEHTTGTGYGFDQHGVDALDLSPIDAYRRLWDKLNDQRGFGWETNPFVWVIEFTRYQEA